MVREERRIGRFVREVKISSGDATYIGLAVWCNRTFPGHWKYPTDSIDKWIAKQQQRHETLQEVKQ